MAEKKGCAQVRKRGATFLGLRVKKRGSWLIASPPLKYWSGSPCGTRASIQFANPLWSPRVTLRFSVQIKSLSECSGLETITFVGHRASYDFRENTIIVGVGSALSGVT